MKQKFGEAWDLLFHPPVAHRGLWNHDGAPENSLAAFQLACEAGYGIELDVQLTSDGEAVFTLRGVTSGRLAELCAKARAAGVRVGNTLKWMAE